VQGAVLALVVRQKYTNISEESTFEPLCSITKLENYIKSIVGQGKGVPMYTLNPETLQSSPMKFPCKPYTLNPKSYTLNYKTYTLNPKP